MQSVKALDPRSYFIIVKYISTFEKCRRELKGETERGNQETVHDLLKLSKIKDRQYESANNSASIQTIFNKKFMETFPEMKD